MCIKWSDNIPCLPFYYNQAENNTDGNGFVHYYCVILGSYQKDF